MSTRGPEIQRLERLADVLVGKGIDGDIAAIKEIGDRLEGKPSQSIGLGQAEDLEPVAIEALRPTLTREAWLKLHSGK